MVFQIGIGIAIAISISNKDRDWDRDLNFGDRGHALDVSCQKFVQYIRILCPGRFILVESVDFHF